MAGRRGAGRSRGAYAPPGPDGDTYRRLESAPQTGLASVNGYAIAGGFELALACDLMIADAQAQLGDEHIRRNLLPSGGSSQRLPRASWAPAAMYYLVTGRRMIGQEAVDFSLAAQAVPAEQLERATLSWPAKSLGRMLALASMKEMVRKSMELPLSDGLRHERRCSIAIGPSRRRWRRAWRALPAAARIVETGRNTIMMPAPGARFRVRNKRAV